MIRTPSKDIVDDEFNCKNSTAQKLKGCDMVVEEYKEEDEESVVRATSAADGVYGKRATRITRNAKINEI